MRRLRGPTLPGTDPHATTTYRDQADRPVTINHATLQRSILDALAGGPQAKWELREALHIPEDVIGRELRLLRTKGKVKITGRQQVAIKWALPTWQPGPPPPEPIANAGTVIRDQKPIPADGSWWTRSDLTRDQFYARAAKGGDA